MVEYNFFNLALFFLCGIALVLTGIPTILNKKEGVGITFISLGVLQIFTTFYYSNFIDEQMVFICKILMVVIFAINIVFFRKLDYLKIFLVVFIFIAMAITLLLSKTGYLLDLNMILNEEYNFFIALDFMFILLILNVVLAFLYFKKKKNSKNLQQKSEKILESFRKKYPEDSFYFKDKLESVEDISDVTILKGVISSKKLLENGCKGIRLEIRKNQDLTLYIERYLDFLSRESINDIFQDEFGIKYLKRSINKKEYLFIGIGLFFQGIIILSIIFLIFLFISIII